jgi:hypothetical protein
MSNTTDENHAPPAQYGTEPTLSTSPAHAQYEHACSDFVSDDGSDPDARAGFITGAGLVALAAHGERPITDADRREGGVW